MHISMLVALMIVAGTLVSVVVNFPKFTERLKKVRKEPQIAQIIIVVANIVVVVSLSVSSILIANTTITVNGQSTLGLANGEAPPGSTGTKTSIPISGATAVVTSTSLPVGTILYQTTNFSAWTTSYPWKIASGQLMNESASSGYQRASFVPTGPNIAIRIQVKKPNAETIIGLFAHARTGRASLEGYQANLGKCASIVALRVRTVNEDCAQSFPQGSDMHLIEFRLKDTALSVSIDGQTVITGNDERYPSPGLIGVYADGQVNIQSFVVLQA